jgi:hypothetical protein
VDEQGRVRFSDAPPPRTARNVERLNLAPPKPEPAQPPFELTRVQKDFPVTLYRQCLTVRRTVVSQRSSNTLLSFSACVKRLPSLI